MPRPGGRVGQARAAAKQAGKSASAEARQAGGRHDPTLRVSDAERQNARRERARVLCGISEEEVGEVPTAGKPGVSERFGQGFLMGSACEGTRRTYSPAWKHWCVFRKLQGKPSFMAGTSAEEHKANEDSMLVFLGIEGGRMGRAYSTVKGAFSSIRFHHIVEGHGDPLVGKARFRMALSALRRVDGHAQRKHPTTTRMLRWLADHLDLDSPRGATLYAAVIVSFFFLMRASEYVAVDGHHYDDEKALKVMDVVPRKDGVDVDSWTDADEIMILIKGSKTDRYNQGEWRLLKRGHGRLCPLWAMANLHRVRPDLREKPGDFLFRHQGGKVIYRKDVQALLMEAAAATGIPPHLIGSHSQRHGGASALYNAGYTVEKIKRFGRWTSDCVHIYLWEGNEATEGMVDAMSRAEFTLNTAAHEQRSRRAWAGMNQALLRAPPRAA